MELRKVHGFRLPKRWPTGLEIATHQDRMSRIGISGPITRTRLGIPTIKDQDSSGCCFGFSAVQAIHIYRQAIGVPSKLLSPVLPYWAARREETSADSDITDSGSNPDGMTKALADFGACAWEEDPFEMLRVSDKPNDTAFLAAQQTKCTILPILATGSSLYLAIEHTICVERKPVLVAIEVVPAFDHPGPYSVIDDPTGKSRGLHAQCLFGIEAEGANTANSWGIGNWTPDGTAVLTPRFIAGAVVWAGSLQVNS